MNAKTILFPTDFSTLADAALEHATALALNMHAGLLILHVEEPPSMYGGGEMYYGVPDPDDSALRAMLAELKPSDSRVSYEHLLVRGVPAAEIVRLAEEREVEMIVMGTHGRTGLGRLLMGSVAEAVVRRAKCPVLTVKSSLVPQHVSE
ncbi:MAG TPA: universal stress protein [Pirellulales bacterium]|nr:universal stress protein [Pirellulales bacterium]